MDNTSHAKRPLFIGALIFACLVGSSIWYFRPQACRNSGPKIDLENIYGKENIVPFLVLGSGPASLSAALYGARTQIKTIVLRGNKPGGQLTGTSYIENWPAIRKMKGTDVVKTFQDQAEHFGAVMVDDVANKVDLTQWPYVVETEEGKKIYAMALMIGTGATPRKLHIPGEHEYWGKGVTTCAICDAPYHRGDHVVVVGGGDSAMEEALELSAYADKVDILVRTDKLKASPDMIERVKKCSNVDIIKSRSIVEIKGDNNHVTNIDVMNNATKQIENMKIQGVFLGIGHDPNTWLVKDQLATSKEGYLTVDCRTQKTSAAGVVAAGDVADPRYRQAGVAAGDGIKAGLDIVWWLSEIGYNQDIQAKLEPYFFDPALSKKMTVAHLNSQNEFNISMKNVKEHIVVLDFFTDTCPTCMHMMPVVDWAATKLAGKARFFKVDASRAFDLSKHFKVPDVPHFLVLRDGEVVGRYHDVFDRAEMYSYIKKFVDNPSYSEFS